MTNDQILQAADAYYTSKLKQHGATARGVDWRDEQSQEARFRQLAGIVTGKTASVAEIGCGYGAMAVWLRREGYSGPYLGIDVSQSMVDAACMSNASSSSKFIIGSEPDVVHDYVVASGVLNVRFEFSDDEWWGYVKQTIELMHIWSSKGFAFNCLTSYSDAEHMRPDLYYADPSVLMRHCMDLYGRRVDCFNDYGLYEFTLHVRK